MYNLVKSKLSIPEIIYITALLIAILLRIFFAALFGRLSAFGYINAKYISDFSYIEDVEYILEEKEIAKDWYYLKTG